MKDFAGRIAVVTGGGSGMGRELVRQLVAEGCSVAMCDVHQGAMDETRALCEADRVPQGVRITTHRIDVSDEVQVLRFRAEVAEQLQTDKIHLLFNNAGIGGGGSLFTDSRAAWEKTFGVCWYGVYYMTRAFLPLLVAADAGHIVNTSSVNGFWASLGPQTPHTAYSAAKFAVKGFTEALITDLRINAPHVKASVVCPGHIGTNIAINSRLVLAGSETAEMTAEELAASRARMKALGIDVSQVSDDQIRAQVTAMGEAFRDNAPMGSAEAATVILDGVKADRWRILVGEDAQRLDAAVRAEPERAYEPDFFTLFLNVPTLSPQAN
jgi:NAD(P)-dependent dehydrogenase (short-subunit alcohol dehydrogenase family)